jgi:acetylornithine/N-succinyldiaminopimelate aminotransferase
MHGTTFGGNPVACAAGVAVLTEIIDNGLMLQAKEIGSYLKNGFLSLQKEFPALVREVRGFGCMLGVDLSIDGQPIVDQLQDRGYLVNCTHQTVLRFLPPFIITRDHCDSLLRHLREILGSLKSA